jgi:23S rRNA (uridine2552-2'-O)-methyltransferase
MIDLNKVVINTALCNAITIEIMKKQPMANDKIESDNEIGQEQVNIGQSDNKRRRVVFSKTEVIPHQKFERVKTARKRSAQSTRWLSRQLNDPYVKRAKAEGWRSRAAYKLIELDDALKLIKRDSLIVDLGVAPGGWAQVALKRGAKRIVGIDLLDVLPIDGVILLKGDFLEPEIQSAIISQLGGRPNLVMSDMAANTVGHRATDSIKTTVLATSAADFAIEFLENGGNFVTKVFQGGAESEMLNKLKKAFKSVKHVKPKSSRAESVELYLVALGKK